MIFVTIWKVEGGLSDNELKKLNDNVFIPDSNFKFPLNKDKRAFRLS